MSEPSTKLSIKDRVIAYIWHHDLSGSSLWRSFYFQLLRTLYVIIRDLGDGQLTLRAMSLVYTTLLSMVPLIAISFSVLKGFGAHNQVEPLLFDLLAPLGEKGVEIGTTIIQFVDNMKVGVLGSVGLVLLLYTVVSLMQKIERALNHAWRVTEARQLTRRVSDYLVVVLIGPVLIGASLGISASIMSADFVGQFTSAAPVETAVKFFGNIIPFILSIAAFTFIYIFIPNTKVRLTSALMGGFSAAVMWKITGWVFASFIVTSSKYAAIYSAFASLVFFMIWLYMSWLILMIGAAVAFYHQHPEYVTVRTEEERLSNRIKEKLALLIMKAVAGNFYNGGGTWTADSLAKYCQASIGAIDRIIGALIGAGILARVDADQNSILPSRPLETLTVAEVLLAVRSAEEASTPGNGELREEPAISEIQDAVEKASTNALGGRTIKDLI